MYQQFTIVGNLGRDPELRHTPGGIPVTNFTMATTKRWLNQEGEQQERTTWFHITAWHRQAETCAQFLKKGSQVMVTGELQEPRTWTDKGGTPHAQHEVTANRVDFLSGNAQGEQDAANPPPAAPQESDGEILPFD